MSYDNQSFKHTHTDDRSNENPARASFERALAEIKQGQEEERKSAKGNSKTNSEKQPRVEEIEKHVPYWRIGANSILARACVRTNNRALPGMQTKVS